MSRLIYADNAATTRLDISAFEAMKPFLIDEYGNASQSYKKLDFFSCEGFLPSRWALAHFLGEPHRILGDQIVSLGFVENLEQHPPAMGKAGIRAPLPSELFQKLLHIVGLNVRQLSPGETVFQQAQGVLVAFLGGGLDVVQMSAHSGKE